METRAVVTIAPDEYPSSKRQVIMKANGVSGAQKLIPIMALKEIKADTVINFVYSPVLDIQNPEAREPTDMAKTFGKKNKPA